MYNGDHKLGFSINGWDGAERDKENDFEEWISPGKERLDCDPVPEFKEYIIQVFKEDINPRHHMLERVYRLRRK